MQNLIIRTLAPFGIFIFPLVYFGSFFTFNTLPKMLFIFALIEIIFFLYIYSSFNKREIMFPNSIIALLLGIYIVVLFIAAIQGVDFHKSFWSTNSHMTGLLTYIHYFIFFFVLSACFSKEEEWRNVFRAISLSGAALVLISFLGKDGIDLLTNDFFLNKGGSLLGTNSFSGIYYLLLFFLSTIGYQLEGKNFWKYIYIICGGAIFFSPELFSFSVLTTEVSWAEVLSNPVLLLGVARTSSLILWAGVLVLLFLLVIHKINNKKKVLFYAAALCFFIGGAYLYSFNALLSKRGEIYEIYVKQSGLARPIVWDMALNGIKEKPILGHGGENFNYVFQKNLNPDLLPLEDTPWFGRAHNFVLDELVSAGIIGFSSVVILFIGIISVSWKLYLKTKKFYLLVVPFVFIFHFLQIQTSFETYSSLLLIFLLLAFLVSLESNKFRLPIRNDFQKFYKLLAFLCLCLALWFFVYMPAVENRRIVSLRDVGTFSGRGAIYPLLKDITIYPPDVLRSLSAQYTREIVNNFQEIQANEKSLRAVQKELNNMIEVYASYDTPNKAEDYKYLLNHAILISNAYMFDVDKLDEAARLAERSLAISSAYPHPYWVLAVGAYYRGEKDQAFDYAEKAFDIDPSFSKSREIYETLKTNTQPKSQAPKILIYIPEL